VSSKPVSVLVRRLPPPSPGYLWVLGDADETAAKSIARVEQRSFIFFCFEEYPNNQTAMVGKKAIPDNIESGRNNYYLSLRQPCVYDHDPNNMLRKNMPE
jgi:hypothetical protein